MPLTIHPITSSAPVARGVGRLEFLAALWARQTGRAIVIDPRPAGR